MKISAIENLMNELLSRGCERTKATFLIEEFKREFNTKKRRQSFLFGKSREPSAREIQNAILTTFRAEIDALYNGDQDQPQNGSTLATSISLLLPSTPAARYPVGNAASANTDILPVPRKHAKRDLLTPDRDANQL
jgi:hypothetical protein